MGPSKS